MELRKRAGAKLSCREKVLRDGKKLLINKKSACAFVALFFACLTFAASAGELTFAQGCEAFKSGDWNSAAMLLRRAAAFSENDNAETWYMLIASEMYAASYAEASADCDYFLRTFSDSTYASYVQYQKGRALVYLGDYEQAVLLLSDFCHHYPDSEMYASALFWIAEAFYYGYNYDEARALYERVVNEFSDDGKARTAQIRLEAVAQRTREEKLLYLLRRTGEAYLAAREDYEKQLRMYDTVSATSSGTSQRAADLQRRNEELEAELNALRAQLASLETNVASANGTGANVAVSNGTGTQDVGRQSIEQNNAAQINVDSASRLNERILELKEKAREAQMLLNEDGGAK